MRRAKADKMGLSKPAIIRLRAKADGGGLRGRTRWVPVWRFGLTVEVGGIRLGVDEGRGVRYPFS